MTLFALFSLTITALLLIAAVTVLFKDSKPAKKDPKEIDKEEWHKRHNEMHDIWYYFGFVDDAPNVIRQVVAGPEKTGRPKRYIANLKYGNIDPHTGIIEMVDDPNQVKEQEDSLFFLNWIRRTFGKRWYGIPFITNVKPLTIDRVVNKNTGQTQEDERKTESYDPSVELEAMPVRRYGLYGEILRPTFHKDMDTKDNIRFSVISYAVLRVQDASIPFNIYTDNYLITISKLISGYVSELTFKGTYNDYKEFGNELKEDQLKELNIRLKALGVEVIKLTFGDPVLHPSVQEAMEAEARATQQRLARKQQGEAEKQFTIDTKEGEAQGIERISKANRSRFEELVELYKANGMTGAEAVAEANKVILGQATADAIATLPGTYAPGAPGVVTLNK